MTKYRFKTKPYKHQVQALKRAIELKNIALLMEPRTGKTKTAIDYLSMLATKGRIDRAVIVAPARVLDVWVQEFHTHCPLVHVVHVWDSDARKAPPPPVRQVHKLTVLLVNYEAFATPGKKLPSGRRSKSSGRYKNRDLIRKWIDGKACAAVLDESHKIKSPSGRASQMIVSMAPDFAYRLILTGTPVTKAKRIFDIHMQWQFLNPDRFADLPTSQDFKNHYGQWTNKHGFPQFLRERNTEELRERIYADAFSVTRAECYDLPEKTVNVRKVSLGSKAGQVYDDLATEMVAAIENEDHTAFAEAGIELTLTLRLSQITGGFVKTTEGETVQVGDDKLKVLEEYIDEAIENDEKLVIVARFRSDLDAIMAMANRKFVPTFAVRGGMKRGDVTENIADFKETEGVAVMALNPQAGGVGIDLSSAAHMIWYSLTPSWVDYTQCCDRIALSKKATTYTYLLAENTVDEVLYDTLQSDGDVAEAILRDPRKVLRT